jgi:hypothetical protein
MSKEAGISGRDTEVHLERRNTVGNRYYIGSVSDQLTTELVREYIRNQKSKDEKLKQKPEYVQASFFDL